MRALRDALHRFNWSRFILVSTVIWTGCIVCGCTATWISAISALLPALGTAIDAIAEFVAALEGKTLSATFVAGVQKVVSDIQTELANLKTILAGVTGTVTASVSAQIQSVLEAIITNLGSILSGADITDSSTVTKLTQLIGIGVSAVQAILALIPVLLARLAATPAPSDEELRQADSLASGSIKHIHEGLRQAYKTVRDDTPTVSADVNTALQAIPASLP